MTRLHTSMGVGNALQQFDGRLRPTQRKNNSQCKSTPYIFQSGHHHNGSNPLAPKEHHTGLNRRAPMGHQTLSNPMVHETINGWNPIIPYACMPRHPPMTARYVPGYCAQLMQGQSNVLIAIYRLTEQPSLSKLYLWNLTAPL